MKKIIKIVGISHKCGEKRDGSKYDFHQVHGTYEDEATQGVACTSVVVPECDIVGLSIGDVCQLHTHYYGGREYYDAIFPAKD